MSARCSASQARRRGFTLVEMLVVIFIIGVLAALLLPAIAGAVAASQRFAMATEIASLQKAIEAYYQEKGDYPPSFGEDYSTGNRENTIVARHLNKCYPKMTPNARTAFFNLLEGANPAPDEALVAWLSRTTADPRDPFSSTTADKKIYFAFDEKRIVDPNSNGFMSYKPKYAKDTNYVYFDARMYAAYDTKTGTKPYYKTVASGNPVEGIAATTFQILCAGLDGDFGSAAANVRKDFPFGAPAGTTPNNLTPEDMDNQTSFSEGKRLKDALP